MKNESEQLKLLFFECMVRIRTFEELLSRLKWDNEITGSVHCCIGQEAISTGICNALNRSDYIMGNHRSHGYMIAKGIDTKRLMAEIFGKMLGTNGGRGGSMHASDCNYGSLGATGIVGSGLPVACGAAFASKYLNDGKVTVVFFGDGASNEGTFHECMNLSAKWNLPIIFVLENNGVAVTTLHEFTTKNLQLYQRAESYGIPGIQISGQDPDEVYEAAKKAITRARIGQGPTLIEALTCRFHEHAEGKGYYRMKDTGYRSEEMISDSMKKYDPILNYEKKLKKIGILTKERVNEIYERSNYEMKQALEYARVSPYPDENTACDNVYFEGVE